MTRSQRLLVAASALVGVQGCLIAWAAADSTTASDGGSSVSVGASSSTSSPASGQPGAAKGSPSPCTYAPLPAWEAAALGQGVPAPGAWYFIVCSVATSAVPTGTIRWIPASPASTGSNPNAAASQAADSLQLPSPEIHVDPSVFSVVNVPTWFWIDPGLWHPFVATATAGGVSATAIASPQTVSWSTGDGNVVVCDGPGTAYDPAVPAIDQTTPCSYTYRQSSVGQASANGDANNGAYDVVATISWSVTWSAVGASGGGTLAPLQTSSNIKLRVEQIESVGTIG